MLKKGEYQIRHGGVDWTVKVTDEEPFPDESAWGYCQHSTRTLVVSTKGNPLATFFHELEHMIGASCSHDTGSKKQHDELDRRANWWASFFADNKDFLKKILED